MNPAFTASASTLADGASATASVNGTYPNLTLALGIPRGATGAPGAPGATGAPGAIGTASTYMLVGPGRPDVASTTGGVITGSEPVGAVFHSTDGASVGAWAWQKTTAGWVVTVGDTGWRDVRSDSNFTVAYRPAALGGSGNAGFAIRRVRDSVIVRAYWNQNTGPAGGILYALPAGFATAFAGVAGAGNGSARVGSAGSAAINLANGTHLALASHTSTEESFLFDFYTDRSWPTTLPGSPA